MTEVIFKHGYLALLAAFPAFKGTDETQKIYWEILKKIPDDRWNRGVAWALDNLDYFPSIHELGDACMGQPDANWRRMVGNIEKPKRPALTAVGAAEREKVRQDVSQLVKSLADAKQIRLELTEKESQ